MITVRFHGRIRSVTGIKIWETDQVPKNIGELLKLLATEKNIEYKELKSAIMFLDGNPVAKMKGLKTPLSENSELGLLSAVAGG